jgi:MFS family permease
MQNPQRLLNAAVVVAALGYFVDVFDLLLFGAVRIKTLSGLGLSGQAITDAGIFIQDWQMIGMFFGGIGSGVLADKIGRVRALYFSIALYSVATLGCGLSDSLAAFTFWRTLAGIGLAGELGTGVTLVSESLPTNKRGLGTAIMATFGILGAVAAGSMGWIVDDWRAAYYIGGGLGLALLALRLSVGESPIFENARGKKGVGRGNFFSFFSNSDRFGRLWNSSLLGVVTWFNTGILMLLAPEFGAARGLPERIDPALTVIWFHIGMSAGDGASGILSQVLKSRLRALRIFLLLQVASVSAYLFLPLSANWQMYLLILLIGFAGGYWAVFITNATEQFGTNLRATAASTAPSIVRIFFIPIAAAFQWLKTPSMTGNIVVAAALVGAACIGTALWASFRLNEPFHKDLDYVEE